MEKEIQDTEVKTTDVQGGWWGVDGTLSLGFHGNKINQNHITFNRFPLSYSTK